MAAETFIELCQQLIDDAGISGTIASTEGQAGELARVVGWVRRACTEIEGRWFNWNFLHTFVDVTTIDAIRDYPAPVDLNLWDKDTFSITDYEQKLGYVDWNRVKTNINNESGDPHTVTILPSKALRFYDTPTSALTIACQYWKVPTVMVANTDTPAIPAQFRDVIVYKALQYYANFESADESKLAGLEQFAPRMIQLESSELPGHQASGSLNTGTDIQVSAGPIDGLEDY